MVGGLQSGALPAAPGRGRSSWPTGPACCRTRNWPRAGSALLRRRLARDAIDEPTVGVGDHARRLSLNSGPPATGPCARRSTARGRRAVRRRASGGAGSPRSASSSAARWFGRRRAAGVVAVPRRLLHRRRPGRGRGRARRRTVRAIDEAAAIGAGDAVSGGRRAARRRPGPGRCPGAGRRGDRRRWCRTRSERGGAPRCRADAPDVLPPIAACSPRWARRWTSPSRSTPATVGVVRRHLPRLVGPGPAAAGRAGRRDGVASYRSATITCRSPADALLSRGMMGDGTSTSPPSRAGSPTPATPATSRWRSSTPTSGRPPATRCWRPWSGGTSNLVEPQLS